MMFTSGGTGRVATQEEINDRGQGFVPRQGHRPPDAHSETVTTLTETIRSLVGSLNAWTSMAERERVRADRAEASLKEVTDELIALKFGVPNAGKCLACGEYPGDGPSDCSHSRTPSEA